MALHFFWRLHTRNFQELVPPPSYAAVSGKGYFASNDGEETDQGLFLHGWGGTGERMRQADVILVGTSHVAFGLSAEALSRKLSAGLGRPVKVFNLGMGNREGEEFVSRILQRNGVRGKVAVIDLYIGPGSSDWGGIVGGENAPRAAVRIGNIWGEYEEARLLYGLLPRFQAYPSHSFQAVPFLNGSCWFRDWETGDTVAFWRPKIGMVYLAPHPSRSLFLLGALPSWVRPHEAYPLVLAGLRGLVEKSALRPIFTLVPHSGYRPQEAAADVLAAGREFLFVPDDGVELFDMEHLVGESRDAVTETVFRRMQDLGLLSWIGERHEPSGTGR